MRLPVKCFTQMGCVYTPQVQEGVLLEKGTIVATIDGPTGKMLTAERLALNFLMRLCGIATHTYQNS